MTPRTKQIVWRLCIGAAAILSVLTFTPVVMPHGREVPALAGVPRALWAGILIAAALVVLTWIGTRVHPGGDDEERA